MDEYQIECRIEKLVDRLDRQYMADTNTMTEAQYQAALKRIEQWAEQQLARAEMVKYPQFNY